MYQIRTIEPIVCQATEQFPALLITGPRQVGKTTVLKQLSQNRAYVTLDDPMLANLAREEPKLFLSRYKPPILIDEIQYAPSLLPFIKMHIDQNPNTFGQFWLTGSQQFQLMQGISESLAGRIAIINLLGLSLLEEKQLTAIDKPFFPTHSLLTSRRGAVDTTSSLGTLYSRIWRGSFPAIVTRDNIDKHLFYSAYIQTYLQRDVRALANVGNESTFLTFLSAAAARTGQILNFSDFARDVGISPNTAKHWLSILQASGIIYLLQPYHNNITKRMIKSPKLYFLDTGLCSYLTQWSSPETLEAGAMSGAIFETYIVTEIIKSFWHNGLRAPIYYYRDKDKKEIDILIEQNQTLYPIEIKKTGNPNKTCIQHFKVLEQLSKPIGEGGVICLIDETIPITENINAISAYCL